MRCSLPFRSFRSLGLVLAVTASTLWGAAPASAQLGEAAGIPDLMQPDFFNRDMTIVEQALQLDDAQRTIVETLFVDYQTAFEAGLIGLKQKYEGMRDVISVPDEKKVRELVFRPFEEWRGEKAAIKSEFLENIKVVLNERQLELWPSFERRLDREKQLPKGRLSGESLDLFDVLREMQLPEPATERIQAVVDQYDLELHEALTYRRQAFEGTEKDMLNALAEQDHAMSLIVIERQTGFREKVREVNDRFIDIIAESMPAEYGPDFRKRALERAYPRVYRETPVQRLFSQARTKVVLDETRLDAVTQLESAYLAELATLNTQLVEAVRTQEPKDQIDRARNFTQRMQGQQATPKSPDPTRPMFDARDEMGRRYAQQLHDLLGEEIYATLPGGMRWLTQQPEPVSGEKNMSAKERNEAIKRSVEKNRSELGEGSEGITEQPEGSRSTGDRD